MSVALQQLIGQINSLGSIKTVTTGIPAVIPPQFFTASRSVVGRSTEYKKVVGRRDGSKGNNYGSPANQVQQTNLVSTPVNLAHYFDVMNHGPLALLSIIGANGESAQANASAEVVRQQVEYLARFETTRRMLVYSMLVNGKIWLDANGSQLFTSSGAAVTIDYGVPAANQNQISTIIGTTWATTSVDIIGDLIAIQTLAVKTSGLPLRHAFYGANIAGYVASNLAAQNLIRGDAGLSRAAYGGVIPDGFAGLSWHPAYEAYGLNEAGAQTDFFGGDTIVFTPDPNPEWYEFVEGSYAIPGATGVVGTTAADALGSIKSVSGMFQYAKVTDNPVGIAHFAGDTCLPILKNGAAIFIADVVP